MTAKEIRNEVNTILSRYEGVTKMATLYKKNYHHIWLYKKDKYGENVCFDSIEQKDFQDVEILKLCKCLHSAVDGHGIVLHFYFEGIFQIYGSDVSFSFEDFITKLEEQEKSQLND